MKTINEIAESYFKTLNPIAERISTDILTIKEAYEDLWNSLTEKERNQIINETVVHPEALLKYALASDAVDGNSEIPICTKVTGSKYVVDDNTGVVWRDEHSAPFSWKTPSQINLSIFTSDDCLSKGDVSFVLTTKTKINQNDVNPGQNFNLKLQNSDWTQKKEKEKSEAEKNSLSPESNVVMVGTCSKLSGLCSKLKFLPSRSYSYEVQTVVNHSACSSADSNILNRIKSTAVHKLQNTLKLIGGKATEKKMADTKEKDVLVDSKGVATIIKVTKASPKISKPTSPPPPPPITNQNVKVDEACGKFEGSNLIVVKTSEAQPQDDSTSENITLLEHNSKKYFSHDDDDNDDEELTPLKGSQYNTIIPKSGFDFLDNW